MTGLAVCVDLGSTYTKALLVDLSTGAVVSTAEAPTTAGTDILEGYDACRASLARTEPGASEPGTVVLACSSAGGGLRIGVLGNEALVTAEAGRRVALSSGGHVVAVAALAGDADPVRAVLEAAPDVVLLTGGTDGGNPEALLTGAAALADAGWTGPVVVAGNVESQSEAVALLAAAPCVVAANVVPRIGVLAPDGARAAVREVFVRHVIGGKRLTSPARRAELESLVRAATPDAVLRGVEVLAEEVGDVVVADVGGATTDVHSVVDLDPEDTGLAREVVASTRASRTVEGDLGMRWSAVTTLGGLPPEDDQDLLGAVGRAHLEEAARRRRDDPAYLPLDDADLDDDEALARVALTIALRRHAGRARVVLGEGGRVVERSGRDLRAVGLLVGSGGVLRHGRPGVLDRVLRPTVGPGAIALAGGGWQLPERARPVLDRDYVLAAVGLLAEGHPGAARELARGLLVVSEAPAGPTLAP